MPQQTPPAAGKEYGFSADRDSGNGVENLTARSTTLDSFLCPSDPVRKLQGTNAMHSYLLSTGTTYALTDQNPWGVRVDGVFGFSHTRHAAGLR